MSDWNVSVDNKVYVELDLESHATLIEIRDLLKQILQRLPAQNIPIIPAPTEIDTRE